MLGNKCPCTSACPVSGPGHFDTRVPRNVRNTRSQHEEAPARTGALSKESLETRQFSRTFLCEDPEGTLCPREVPACSRTPALR